MDTSGGSRLPAGGLGPLWLGAPKRWPLAGRIFALGFLLFFGGNGLWMGVEAFRTGTLTVGFGGSRLGLASQIILYRGAEARRIGAGCLAAGAMLAIWAAAILKPGPLSRSPCRRILTIASLALLLGTMALWLPPWRIGRDRSVAVFSVFLGVQAAVLWNAGRRRRSATGVFAAVTGVGIVFALVFGDWVWEGLLPALFVLLVAPVHLAMLRRDSQER